MAASIDEMENLQLSDSSTDAYQEYQSRALQALQLFSASRDQVHIEEALTNGRKANDLATDDLTRRAGSRTILGVILVQRAQWSEDIADLEEATKVCREAVEAVIESQEHSEETTKAMFTNLVTALSLRYRLSANPQHLDDGITTLQDVLLLTQLNSPGRRLCLGALSKFLDTVHRETKNPAHEDRAIETAREALALEPDPSVPSSSMTRLIDSLVKRHMRTHSPSDFGEAVDLAELAVERDDHQTSDPSALGDLTGQLCDLYQDRFETTNDTELLKRAIALNAKIILQEPGRGKDPRRTAVSIVSLKQKVALHVKATDTMPSDISVELLLKRPNLVQLLVPAAYPRAASWLNDTAQRFRQHCRDVKQLESTAEAALVVSMMAMSKIDPEHEDWGMVEDGYRESWKLWSSLTGKMPEFFVSAMLFERKQSTWLPPEVSEHDLGLVVPCMTNFGKLYPERETF